MENKKNRKGFTLAELLIVVAIIAVLVAIAIPVFTRQLEKSREATDLSNIRSAYAEAVSEYLADGANAEKTATVNKEDIKQTVEKWQTTPQPTLETRVNGVQADVSLPENIVGDDVTVYVHADGSVEVLPGKPAASDESGDDSGDAGNNG